MSVLSAEAQLRVESNLVKWITDMCVDTGSGFGVGKSQARLKFSMFIHALSVRALSGAASEQAK